MRRSSDRRKRGLQPTANDDASSSDQVPFRPEVPAPPLLQRIYGKDNVVSLRELLLRLCQASGETERLRDNLVKRTDHPEYSHGLLNGTFCVVEHDAPNNVERMTLQQTFEQFDLIRCVIEHNLKKKSGASRNILCKGYRLKRPSNSGMQLVGSSLAEHYYYNSLVETLLSPPWQMLLSRIGDRLMLYLLMYVSMFVSLPNGCCFQLSGPPVDTAARQVKRIESEKQALAVACSTDQSNKATCEPRINRMNETNTLDLHQGRHLVHKTSYHSIKNENKASIQKKFNSTRKKDLDVLKAAKKNDPVFVEGKDRACLGTEHVPESKTVRNRRVNGRKSSWQRKKQKIVKSSKCPVLCENEFVRSEGLQSNSPGDSVPCTLPINDETSSRRQSNRNLTVSSKNTGSGHYSSKKVHVQWPKYQPKPMDMVIPRFSIFYSSTYRKQAGFPKKHILNRIAGNKKASRILYNAIFNSKLNPTGRRFNLHKPVHLTAPEPASRISAKDRHLLPLLESIVRRTHKCPFGILLNAYCPLPKNFRMMQTGLGINKSEEAVLDAAAANHKLKCKPNSDRYNRSTEYKKNTKTDINEPLNSLFDDLFCFDSKRKGADMEPKCLNEDLSNQRSRGERVHHRLADFPDQFSSKRRTNKRSRQTGLAELILAAGTQIQPTVSIGLNSTLRNKPVAERNPTDTQLESQLETCLSNKNKIGNEEKSFSLPATEDLLTNPVPCSRSKRRKIDRASCNQHLDNKTDLSHEGQRSKQTQTNQDCNMRFSMTNEDSSSCVPLASCFVPHAQVTGFVWAVVKRCIPAALLGSVQCRRGLRSSIHKFISLRRYENMTVNQIMQHQKLSEIRWLYPFGNDKEKRRQTLPPSRISSQQRCFSLWLGWLFSCFIVPLLRAHFFCTESEAYRQQVFYYRKRVWNKLKKWEIDSLCEVQFAAIPESIARQTLERRKLGVARLRLLPKRSGMRFIVNMGRKSTVKFKRRKNIGNAGLGPLPKRTITFDPVNSQLRDLHKILKLELARQPEAFGSSVFGYNDIYCYLHPFTRRWRSKEAALSQSNPMNQGISSKLSSYKLNPNTSLGDCDQQASVVMPSVVSMDVSRAFDHVNIDILLDLVTRILKSEQYMVIKYNEIVSSMTDIRVIPRSFAVPLEGSLVRNPKTESSVQLSFPERASNLASAQRNKIFVDNVVYVRIRRENAISILRQHLTANIVHLKRKWHCQRRGIAQGSTLSSLLCCLYLGHVENECLYSILRGERFNGSISMSRSLQGFNEIKNNSFESSLSRQKSVKSGRLSSIAAEAEKYLLNSKISTYGLPNQTILLRQIDDWLLITKDRTAAAEFAYRVVSGLPQYNILVNPDKTKLSFDLKIPGKGCIQSSTYQAADGARFIKWCGLILNVQTLEFQGDYTRYSGEHVSTALTLAARRAPGQSLGVKLCYYLRPKAHPLLLDSGVNSYKTIRINVYQNFLLSAMKFHCHIRWAFSSNPARSSGVLFDAIEKAIKFMVKMSRPRKVAPTHRPEKVIECDPQLPPIHVRYLGLHAFKTVLSRKQTRYCHLLQKLDEELADPACARCAKTLEESIDPVYHTIFDTIMY